MRIHIVYQINDCWQIKISTRLTKLQAFLTYSNQRHLTNSIFDPTVDKASNNVFPKLPYLLIYSLNFIKNLFLVLPPRIFIVSTCL